jgi:antitoxin ParD1/3/4
MTAMPLPPELEQFVSDQIAKGNFESSSDVVCHAVRLLRERQIKLEALRAEIDRGLKDLESGNYIELDSESAIEAFFDDIAARSKQRLSAMQADS